MTIKVTIEIYGLKYTTKMPDYLHKKLGTYVGRQIFLDGLQKGAIYTISYEITFIKFAAFWRMIEK